MTADYVHATVSNKVHRILGDSTSVKLSIPDRPCSGDTLWASFFPDQLATYHFFWDDRSSFPKSKKELFSPYPTSYYMIEGTGAHNYRVDAWDAQSRYRAFITAYVEIPQEVNASFIHEVDPDNALEVEFHSLFRKKYASVCYTWDFGDGTTHTTEDRIVRHRFASPGLYKITHHVENRCSRRSRSELLLLGSTALDDERDGPKPRIHPHPVGDYSLLRFSNDRQRRHDLRIYDMRGKLIDAQISYASEFIIRGHEMAAGVYLYQLSDGKARWHGKLLVE